MSLEAACNKEISETSLNSSKIGQLKCVTPSIIRKGLCMMRVESDTVSKLKRDCTKKSKGLLEYSSKLAESAVKYGAEVANSSDPLQAAIAVGGKTGVGVSLSRFSASQCAGLIGVIVTSISPQTSVPLLLKKISEDLDYLKQSLDIVRANPQFMANEFLSISLLNLNNYNFDEALKNLERANYEATKGIHMAPTFKGLLGCIQIKTFSSVMLECASSLNGIPCFSPLNCLTEEAKGCIENIIRGGLETIMEKAKTKTWNGKLKISAKTQNMIDPYLAALYNTYSLASSLTDPYHSSESEPPKSVLFSINTTFIAEGENDCCKLEVLLHDEINIVLFIWKEFKGEITNVFLRHKRTAWYIDATHASCFDIEYCMSNNSMKTNGIEMNKLVGWPVERKSIQDLLTETVHVKRGSFRKICKKTYKWIEHVPEQYLHCMEMDLDKAEYEGLTLLHALADINEFKNMGRLMGKIKNIDPTDKSGRTPLHRACMNLSFSAAKLLIRNGANVNALTTKGNSPLMLLARNKKQSFSLVKLLIEFGAKRQIEDNEGMRALDIANTLNASDRLKKLLHPG